MKNLKKIKKDPNFKKQKKDKIVDILDDDTENDGIFKILWEEDEDTWVEDKMTSEDTWDTCTSEDSVEEEVTVTDPVENLGEEAAAFRSSGSYSTSRDKSTPSTTVPTTFKMPNLKYFTWKRSEAVFCFLIAVFLIFKAVQGMPTSTTEINPQIRAQNLEREKIWWKAITQGKIFSTGNVKELKFTKKIMRREVYIPVIQIVGRIKEGIDVLKSTWPHENECEKWSDVPTCKLDMARMEGSYMIALHSWGNVAKLLNPLCSDAPLQDEVDIHNFVVRDDALDVVGNETEVIAQPTCGRLLCLRTLYIYYIKDDRY